MNVDIAMYAIVFMVAGFTFRGISIKKIFNAYSYLCVTLMIILFCLAMYYYSFDMNTRLYTNVIISTFGAIAGSGLFLLICKRLYRNNLITEALCFCGRYSLVILCVHILEHSYLPWNSIYNIIPSATLIIIIKMIIILLCVFIIRRIKILNYIYC